MSRVGRLHPAVLGALAGLGWGVVARVWMRFISEHPEFTWSGTGFILGAATVAGLSLGWAHALWRSGGPSGWRLAGLPVVLLGGGAGSIMLPTVAAWGAAIARRGWPRWLRLLLVAAGLVPQAVVVADVELEPVRLALALAWYALLLAAEAWGVSLLFRPAPEVVKPERLAVSR